MAGSRGPLVFPEFAALQLRFDVGEKFFDGQLLQILCVEPFELGAIENTVDTADAFQRKLFQQLAGAQEFFIAAGRPAEQREKIAEGFWKKTFAAVQVDVSGAVALGEARFVRAKNQRKMGKDGDV